MGSNPIKAKRNGLKRPLNPNSRSRRVGPGRRACSQIDNSRASRAMKTVAFDAMCCTMNQMIAPTKTTRISVPLSPEVLEKFKRFSQASGLSLGKSIGDWLKDTASGLDAMTDILEAHKRSPAQAMEKLALLASAMQDMTGQAIQGMKSGPSPLGEGVPPAGKSLAVAKAAMVKAAAFPPLSNTGGKLTTTKTAKPPKKIV